MASPCISAGAMAFLEHLPQSSSTKFASARQHTKVDRKKSKPSFQVNGAKRRAIPLTRRMFPVPLVALESKKKGLKDLPINTSVSIDRGWVVVEHSRSGSRRKSPWLPSLAHLPTMHLPSFSELSSHRSRAGASVSGLATVVPPPVYLANSSVVQPPGAETTSEMRSFLDLRERRTASWFSTDTFLERRSMASKLLLQNIDVPPVSTLLSSTPVVGRTAALNSKFLEMFVLPTADNILSYHQSATRIACTLSSGSLPAEMINTRCTYTSNRRQVLRKQHLRLMHSLANMKNAVKKSTKVATRALSGVRYSYRKRRQPADANVHAGDSPLASAILQVDDCTGATYSPSAKTPMAVLSAHLLGKSSASTMRSPGSVQLQHWLAARHINDLSFEPDYEPGTFSSLAHYDAETSCPQINAKSNDASCGVPGCPHHANSPDRQSLVAERQTYNGTAESDGLEFDTTMPGAWAF